MSKIPESESPVTSQAEADAARAKVLRQRNLVMALGLAALVVLFFLITIAKIRH